VKMKKKFEISKVSLFSHVIVGLLFLIIFLIFSAFSHEKTGTR
jgi:uncharacterized integral membrane protein